MTQVDPRHLWSGTTTTGRVQVIASVAADGDFNVARVPHDVLMARCRSLADLPWCLADEHHGCGVVEATTAQWSIGAPGDIVVTSEAGLVAAVWVGDCAPVMLIAADGRIAAAHAGWRGLAAGALDAALATVAPHEEPDGAGTVDPAVRIVIGPCIGPCCYEFGVDDLERVALGLGASVGAIRGQDRHGRPALDLRAAITAWSARVGASVVAVDPRCTGCDDQLYSYRVDRDLRRQVVGVWRDRQRD